MADILRKQIGLRERKGKHIPPILVAANKTETTLARESSVEFYRLGLGEVYPTSAMQGEGTGDLLDAVVAAIPQEPPAPPDESIKIALVGRPNVGKSSLFNQLIGESRVIVSNVPGTTRDAIDTRIDYIDSSSNVDAEEDEEYDDELVDEGDQADETPVDTPEGTPDSAHADRHRRHSQARGY